MRGPIRASLASSILLALSACGVLPTADVDVPPFPECDVDAFAFHGTTTLAALGLGEMFPDQASRTGRVWVTAEPNPEAFDAPPGMPPPDQRLVCVAFEDGSGMVGPIDDTWQSPASEPFDITSPSTRGMLGPLAAVVGVAILVVVSVLAFRGERTPDS